MAGINSGKTFSQDSPGMAFVFYYQVCNTTQCKISVRFLIQQQIISQNHTMLGVGRDPCGLSSPNPCQNRFT